jgi:hypothetical protein
MMKKWIWRGGGTEGDREINIEREREREKMISCSSFTKGIFGIKGNFQEEELLWRASGRDANCVGRDYLCFRRQVAHLIGERASVDRKQARLHMRHSHLARER